MLIRFRPDVIDLKPKAVVILAGTNDIAGNTGPMTVEQVEENYASMAELAKANDIRVVFSSVIPVNNYTPQAVPFFLTRSQEKILALNEWLKTYCATNGHVYLDYFSAMVDEKRNAEAEFGGGRAASQQSWIRVDGTTGGGGDPEGNGGKVVS